VYQQIVSKSADYTVQDGDDLILVDASGGGVTVTLPTPLGRYPGAGANVGDVMIVKTDSSPYPVTIAPAAGSVIGQSVLRQQYQSARFISDGIANWYNFAPLQTSFEVQVALSSANILAMNGAPVTLIPAPGAGKIIIVEDILLKMVTTATQYANGGAVEFRYTNGSGAKVSADIAATVITATAGPSYTKVLGIEASLTPVANAPIVITNATAAFTTGTGTGVLTIKFRVVTP
jgi:hypothetical protein